MKLKMWVNEESAKKDDEGQLYLKLNEDNMPTGERFINLCVVDRKGEIIDAGTILSYYSRIKCFYTHNHINDIISLKTNLYDSILIYTDDEVKDHALHLKKLMIEQKIQEEHDKSCKECNDHERHSKH